MSNWKQTPPLRARLQTPGPPAADLLSKLRQALALHQQGQLAEAERAYHGILGAVPDQPDALHYLGVLEVQRGNLDAAIELMSRSLAANPRNPAALYNRANACRDAGRLVDALAGYDAAIALKPDNIAAMNNRGVALYDLRRYEEAIASYDRVLAVKSDYADAHANRGNALMELARHEEALESYDRALAAMPNQPAAWYGRGNALGKLERFEEAIAAYDRGLRLMPNEPRILNNRGQTLSRLSRHEEAIVDFDRALAQAPNSVEPLTNRGDALMHLQRYEEALASYGRALEINQSSNDALYGRASALVELKRHGEAIAAFDRLLRQKPDYPYAQGMLVYAQQTCCDWQDPSQKQKMIDAIRADERVATPLVLLTVSDSAADKLHCAQIVIRHKYAGGAEPLWRGEIYRHERIRLGYVSADFRTHPVATQIAGVFEQHDRSRFETIAISHGTNDGSIMRRRLEGAFDRFIDLHGKSDADIAALMRAMEIDIAVDLTGFTASARPGIFMLRPAPVQVNYLGFAASMGTPNMDYLLADAIAVPAEQQQFYVEKLAYLPDSYMPHDSKRLIAKSAPSRADAGLPEQGFVFASFNNSYKFAPETFGIWMRLLCEIPESVLWLPRTNETAVKNLRREAEARGVAPERIIFAPHLSAAEDHLARLSLGDLFLDTLPYNAHSTAVDALWAGLPVLTCKGESFAGRVAASLLQAAGLPELIAETPSAYESLALDLAHNPAKLGGLKEKLRHNRETSPLFDTARFTRNLESAFTTMWDRTQRGLPPESFAVEPQAHTPP
jgi:predicted O-linked N-acetylglucosamine transferase (SPINDLY family)